MNSSHAPTSQEWLETDGLGGFASGTATGIRTRRYHALLLTATTPPTGRVVLVNGFDAWIETASGSFSLSSQCYAPDVLGGDGTQRIETFGWEPWPHWIYKLEDGTRIELEIFGVKGEPMTCLSWKLLGPSREVKLFVRPFLSGRDYHSLHKSNSAFRFDAELNRDRVSWEPYPSLPAITALTNGQYMHDPHWYYHFLYEEERACGLDCEEDLAAPGVISWELGKDKAALILTTTEHAATRLPAIVKPVELFHRLRVSEQERRKKFPSRLHKAAEAYVVSGRQGKTILAGYPWFTDWGRDTFIALRGLCLATGRLDDARQILLAWANAVSQGMLPNRFPDQGEQPEFNAVDASLWFVIAVHYYLEACRSRRGETSLANQKSGQSLLTSAPTRKKLLAAVEAILDGYSQGTRFGIRADNDGLLMAGQPGVQLTWMDAKVGDWVVTPRIGKPVEIEALWLNALWIGSQHDARWIPLLERGRDSFDARFWNKDRRMLYDVVDVNHQPGAVDPSFRPNQILALGGLPLRLVDDNRAFLIVEAVKDHLWTPLGLRSLAPGEPGYVPHYYGGISERDGAYHQGTVWPWLLGAYVDAWTWVHRNAPGTKREARRQYLQPLLDHLEEAGLGHISEIADAEAPHTPRGCPFQAWSVGEVLWLDQVVLAEEPAQTKQQPPYRSRRKEALVPKLVPELVT